MTIRLLPSEVASQIAAGEVVERPASVVKELLENALDAEASFISITVEKGGQGLVEVSDNGIGIPKSEIHMAVERHATSKLSNAEDLFNIASLGFRGEALASIGSVSRLSLISRPAEAEAGARIRVDGGITGEVERVGAAVGTVVRVEDLFYNVPARRKFLKRETTERRVIQDMVTRYAIAFPDVRFHLRLENRLSLQTSGKGDRREVLASMNGIDIARQMLEVLALEEDLGVTGYISPTSLTRSNRREISFFVNGRPIQDSALVAAVLRAYHTYLMTGRYPIAVLFLDVPTDTVDVNVHPTKAEVRFRDPDKMFVGVQRAVRRALLAHAPVPGLDMQVRWSDSDQIFPGQVKKEGYWESGFTSADQNFVAHPETRSPSSVNLTASSTVSPGSSELGTPQSQSLLRTPILRLVGQIANAYLVAEGPDGLYLVDQHAAHERVLFEQLIAQKENAGNAGLPSQTLLQPVTVELSATDALLIEEQLPILTQLGFTVEVFGQNTFLIRAIPELLSNGDPRAGLRALVEDFEEDESPLEGQTEARLAARVCKRMAVKAGQSLSPIEQANLLQDLEKCQQPRTCPHGRPTMIHLPVDLLERQFGRRGPR